MSGSTKDFSGPESADRNLTFAVEAWRIGFIDEAQLLEALRVWTFEKTSSIGEILLRQGVIDQGQHELVRQVADRIAAAGQAEAQRRALELPSVAQRLRQEIDDEDVDRSLATISCNYAGHARSAPVDTSAGTSAVAAADRFGVARHRELGKGGLGVVYVAFDNELNREVAFKEIQDWHADHPDSQANFLLEAEVTGGLEHPGVVPVYSASRDAGGRPFYAMKLIRGQTLAKAIAKFHADFPAAAARSRRNDSARSLHLRQLLARFVSVCQTVSFAHSRGVLHRDIKPDNVMLGSYGETYLLDWGLTRLSDRDEEAAGSVSEKTFIPELGSGSNETQEGSAKGTPRYMSPEQAAGRVDQIGFASDVYGLGATLYELLAGRPAFEMNAALGKGERLGDILYRVRRGDFEAPRMVDARVPKALEAICLKAMATDPAQRYQKPRQLADEIERWLADEPVKAYPESAAARSRRWVRRHQTLAASSLLTVLLIAAGMGMLSAVLADNNRRLSVERRRADAAAIDARQQAAIATAVTDFLHRDVLEQASPRRNPNPNLTIAELLLAAEKELDTRFGNQPQVRRRLLVSIGTSLAHLGENRHAERILKRAREELRSAGSAASAETWRADITYAECIKYRGRYREAESILQSVMDAAKQNLGRNAQIYADAVLAYADQLSTEGRIFASDDVLDAFDRVAAELESIDSEARVHASLLRITNLMNLGIIDRARDRIGQLRPVVREQLGPHHWLTLELALHHARLLMEEDKIASAQQELENTQRIMLSQFSAGHPSVFAVRLKAAEAMVRSGDLEAARAEVDQLLEEHSKHFGVDNSVHLDLRQLDIALEVRRENWRSALKKSEDLFDEASRLFGEDSVIALRVLQWQPLLLGSLERTDDAKAVLDKLIVTSERLKLPATAIRDLVTLSAMMAESDDEVDRSIRLLKSQLEEVERQGLGGTAYAEAPQAAYINLLIKSGNVEDAVAYVDNIARGQNDASPARLYFYLGRALREHGDADAAGRWLHSAFEQALKMESPTRTESTALAELANYFLNIEDYDRSLTLYERFQTRPDWREELPVDIYTTVLHDYGFLLKETDRLDEAAPVLEQALSQRRKVYGDESGMHVLNTLTLLTGLRATEQDGRSIEVQTHFVAKLTEQIGPTSSRTVQAMNHLIELQLDANQFDAAVQSIEDLKGRFAGRPMTPISYAYDLARRTVKTEYRDEEGDLTESVFGMNIAGWLVTYDDQGREIRRDIIDTQGKIGSDSQTIFQSLIFAYEGPHLGSVTASGIIFGVNPSVDKVVVRFDEAGRAYRFEARDDGDKLVPFVAGSLAVGFQETFDEEGREVRTDYLNTDGEIGGRHVNGHQGHHSSYEGDRLVKRTYFGLEPPADQRVDYLDERGRIHRAEYRDADGQIVKNPNDADVAGWQSTFDEAGREVRRDLLTTDGEPGGRNSAGYRGWTSEYEGDRLVKMTFFGNDPPAVQEVSFFDQAARLYRGEYRDADGNIVKNARDADGAGWLNTFDASGREIRRDMLNTDGEIGGRNNNGFQGWTTEYEGDRIVSKTYFGNDPPAVQQVTSYDDHGRAYRHEYRDAVGTPVENPRDQNLVGWLLKFDEADREVRADFLTLDGEIGGRNQDRFKGYLNGYAQDRLVTRTFFGNDPPATRLVLRLNGQGLTTRGEYQDDKSQLTDDSRLGYARFDVRYDAKGFESHTYYNLDGEQVNVLPMIEAVFPDGQAAAAGMQVGDVILRYHNTTGQMFDIVRTVRSLPTQADTPEEVEVRFWRDGEDMTRTVKPGRFGVMLEDYAAEKVMPKELAPSGAD